MLSTLFILNFLICKVGMKDNLKGLLWALNEIMDITLVQCDKCSFHVLFLVLHILVGYEQTHDQGNTGYWYDVFPLGNFILSLEKVVACRVDDKASGMQKK